MKLPSLFPSAVLMGTVLASLVGASHSFGQAAARPKAVTRTVTTTKPSFTTNDTTSGTTSAATDPVGFTSLSLPANSDTLVSIPFTRPAAFSGAIGSISGSTITVSSSPNWTMNQYVYASGTQPNTYYAIIGPSLATVSGTVALTNGSTTVTATAGLSAVAAGDEFVVNGLAYNVAQVTSDTSLTLSRAFTGTTTSGQTATYDHSPKEGSSYMVTANGTNSLTVSLNGDSLSTVTAGTTVTIIPYWTLGTAFPLSDKGTSYIESTDTTPRFFQTQILMPNLTTPGVNLSSTATYVYYSGAWRLFSTNGLDTSTAYDNLVLLPPTTYFTVRNSSTGTTFTPTGNVVMNRLSIPLDTQASGSQDNAVAVSRPAGVTLNDLDLVSSGAFVPSTDTTPRFFKDVLLTYDNTQTGVNKASNATYIYYQGGWRLFSTNGLDTNTDYGNTTVIPYGTGFTIRKAAATNGATSFWQNTRNY